MGSLDSSNKMKIDMETYESPAPLENQEKVSGNKTDSLIKISEHTSSVCTFHFAHKNMSYNSNWHIIQKKKVVISGRKKIHW